MAGGRCLWENNRFGFSDHKGLDVRTPNNIIRGNAFYRHGYGGIQVATNLPGIDRADENHIYQNTFFRNGHGVQNPGFQGGMYFANWQKNGATGQPKDNVVKNNLFYDNKNGSTLLSEGPVDPQKIENNWDKNDENPGFINLNCEDPDVADLPDLRVSSSSPVRDRGTWLTTITSDDATADKFTVDDSNYFTDGWGIIEGDRVQLEGDSNVVTIKRIDYETHSIAIDREVSYRNGQGIALAYAGKAPDLGAEELQK